MGRIKYDYSKLRGRIVEKFGTMSNFADKSNLTRVSVSNKLNGKVNLVQTEMEKWAELLDIPVSEYPQYFFAHQVPIVEKETDSGT